MGNLLVRQRTVLMNALRGHLAEFGMVAGKGPGGVATIKIALNKHRDQLLELARSHRIRSPASSTSFVS
jgi:transposase